jgi:hypothetical protein
MPLPPSSVATQGSLDSDSLPQTPSTLKELSKTLVEDKTIMEAQVEQAARETFSVVPRFDTV